MQLIVPLSLTWMTGLLADCCVKIHEATRVENSYVRQMARDVKFPEGPSEYIQMPLLSLRHLTQICNLLRFRSKTVDSA